MITKDNFKDVIKAITPKDKKRILTSIREFCFLQIHFFNVGYYVTVKLSKNFRNTNYLECVFYTDTIAEELKSLQKNEN